MHINIKKEEKTMFKKVSIKFTDGSEKEIGFMATGATPIYFKKIFGKDLLKIFKNANEDADSTDLNVVDELAFVMSMQAEGANTSHLSVDDYCTWADKIETMELESKSNEIMSVYLGSTIGSSEPKKKAGKLTVK